jgi:hypothetical protein
MNQKVSVFGAGAWGTTMAQVLHDAGNEVLLWGRSEDVVSEINASHTNTKYLDAHVLPEGLRASSDLAAAFAHSQIYVLAIPAQQLRTMLAEWKPLVNPDAVVVSTLKGIEISTQMRMSEIIEEMWGTSKVGVITGPNLADELVMRQPAGAVAAGATSVPSVPVVENKPTTSTPTQIEYQAMLDAGIPSVLANLFQSLRISTGLDPITDPAWLLVSGLFLLIFIGLAMSYVSQFITFIIGAEIGGLFGQATTKWQLIIFSFTIGYIISYFLLY